MKTLQNLASRIETLQAQYRRASALNHGVLRGAVETASLSAEIQRLQAAYNTRAKTTMYSGGRIVQRSA